VTPAQMDFIQRRRFFNDTAFWASIWESVKWAQRTTTSRVVAWCTE